MLQRASIAVCSVGRSTAHMCRTPWNCGRCPKEKWQITKILHEVFLTGGPLSIWGEFTLIFPVGPVKPFHTQSRGERLEVASMDAGESKIPGVVPQTTIKNDGSPGTLRRLSRFSFYIFCFRDRRRSRAGRILMRFKGLFSRGKVTGA